MMKFSSKFLMILFGLTLLLILSLLHSSNTPYIYTV